MFTSNVENLQLIKQRLPHFIFTVAYEMGSIYSIGREENRLREVGEMGPHSLKRYSQEEDTFPRAHLLSAVKVIFLQSVLKWHPTQLLFFQGFAVGCRSRSRSDTTDKVPGPQSRRASDSFASASSLCQQLA